MNYNRTDVALGQSRIQKDMDYSDIMVSELQTGWSISYQQEDSNFVADKWFPMISVSQIAGYYPKWSKKNAFTNAAGTWRPGSLPPAADLGIDDPGFFACIRYAFQTQLLADLPFVASPVYNLKMATTRFVSDVLRLNKELIIKDKFFKTGVWDIDVTGVNSGETWTSGDIGDGDTFRRLDDSDSDPLGLFMQAKLAIKEKIGVMPNTLILGEKVYEALRINEQLVSLYRNPQGADKVPTKLNEERIAEALDVNKIIVARAMYNTTPASGTCTLDWVFGNGMWYGYTDSPGEMKTVAGMNLSFDEPLGGFNTAFEVVPDLLAKTEWYRGFQCFVPVVMASDAGMFFDQVIA